MSFELHHGDCLEIMPRLVERFDGIFTDVPYGTTACKWDTIIPLEPMWKQVKRLLKPNGAFITTASQPFTSVLVMSNLEWFIEEIIWKKDKASNFMLAKKRHQKYHENICIFSKGIVTYNPIFQDVGYVSNKKGSASKVDGSGAYRPLKEHGDYKRETTQRYPSSIQEFYTPKNNDQINGCKHPTQKPVALYEYLIRTYSNPGDIILDFAMGSCTTGVAAIRTGRHFVGIEKEREYYEIAEQRIRSAQPALFVEDESLLTPRETDLLRSGAAGAKNQLSMFAGDGDE